MRRAGLVVVLVVTVLAGCSSGPHFASPDPHTVKVTTFAGQPDTLATYTGKPLVVNFWSSTCVPCKTELPGIESLHKAFGPKVTFLGVDTNDTVSDGQAMAHTAGLTYSIVRDPRGTAIAAFNGIGLPTTVLIAPSGQVVFSHLGELKASELRNLIDRKLLT